MNKKEAVTIIRSLLSSTNSSFGIYTLNKEFRDETGIDIPLFGYSSLSEFLASIPDTVKLTGLYPIQKVSLVKNDVSAHVVSLVKRQRRDKKPKKGISVNTGGHCFKINRDRKFAMVSDKKLNIKENRLPNLVRSVVSPEKNIRMSLNQKIDVINQGEKLDRKKWSESSCDGKNVLPTKNYFKTKAENCSSVSNNSSSFRQTGSSNCSLEAPPLANICSSPLLRISNNFVESDVRIPANDLKLHAKIGHYVEVYPCEIFHPGLFYFHFRELKKKLTRFMNELQKFYHEHEEIPRLSETPKPEQVCAVCYSRYGDVPRWHRVQVEEILSDSLVVVRLVDYGTTTKILVKNLRLLHRNFISFPRQAVLGSLANIKPSGGSTEWSKSATRKFHELAFCRDLVGGVVSINYDACSLSVALSSTDGEEVHVNDTLVGEGLAEFDEDVVNDVEKSKTEIKEAGERSSSPIKEIDLSPVFYSKQNHKNSRLQKMFTASE